MHLKLILKKELLVALYYFVATYIAVVAPYLALMSRKDSIINATEAWKNVAPYIKSVLLIFVVFVTMRLVIVTLVCYFRGTASTRNA